MVHGGGGCFRGLPAGPGEGGRQCQHGTEEFTLCDNVEENKNKGT